MISGQHLHLGEKLHLRVSKHVEHCPTFSYTDFLLFITPYIVYSHDTKFKL